jgi:TonB family protein
MSSFASSVSPSSQVERRSYARRRIDGLTYADFGADNGAIILDLGEGGLGFQSVTPVSLGQAVLLKFKLPGKNDHVESYAEVAWLNESGKGGGLRFVELNGNARVQIHDWLGAESRPEAARRIRQAETVDRSDSTSVQESSPDAARPNPTQETGGLKPAIHPETPALIGEDSGAVHSVEAAAEALSADSAALPIPEVTKRPEAPEADDATSPAATQIASAQAAQRMASSAPKIAAARPAAPAALDHTDGEAPRTPRAAINPAAEATNTSVAEGGIDLTRRAHLRSHEPDEFRVPGIPVESTDRHWAVQSGPVDASASEITDPAPAGFRRAGGPSTVVPGERRTQSAPLKAAFPVPAPYVGQSNKRAPASQERENPLANQERELTAREMLRSQAVKVAIGTAAGVLLVLGIVASVPSLRTRVQATANKGLSGSADLAAGAPAFQVEVADISNRRWILRSGGDAGSPFSDSSPSRREAQSAAAAAARSESAKSSSSSDASSTPENTQEASQAKRGQPGKLVLSRPRVIESVPTTAQVMAPSIFDGITPPIGSFGDVLAGNGQELPRPAQQAQPGGRAATLQAAVLLQQVPPVYPTVARQSRIRGEVHVSATIGTDGVPKNLKVVNGDQRLVDAALAAIRQWRYRPATLGGEPIESQTVVSVSFELN